MPGEIANDRVRIFGIRHHGPGSARRMLDRMRRWEPDLLLVECPEDAQPALEHIGDPGLVPPVAILLYDPQDHTRAIHYPMAGFSPEWLALNYARAHHVPVRCMDLPWSVWQGLSDHADREEEEDPFTVISRTMGYSDTERWWEYYFEQVHAHTDLFPYIRDLMGAFREGSTYGQSLENRLREAWMRRCLQRALAEGYQRIVVVCGAFHAPALEVASSDPAEDEALLRPLKTGTVQATWIPWTYGQLARQHGYGAGMVSPAWYELLYEHPDHPTRYWMARCARFLRDKGLAAPPAGIPAAVEMAESLATLRGMHQPGMEELEDAALAVFVQGDPQWLFTIREELLIGDRMGKVPPTIPRTPLQEDFHRQVRRARLSRALETPGRVALDLDLRKPTNLQASILLHRLELLDLPWGRLLERGALAKGNFRENWRLEWKPSYDLRLLACGTWGLTLETAAHNFALAEDPAGHSPADLASRLYRCLQARLPGTAHLLAARLRDLSAHNQDVWAWAVSLTPLIQVHKFGEAFSEEPPDLEPLLEHLIPRTLIGLPRAVQGLDARQLQLVPDRWRQLIADLKTYGQLYWQELFWQGLLPLTDDPALSPRLHGSLCRLAREENRIDNEELGHFIRDALRSDRPAAETAEWIGGLLAGAEDLLLRNQALWQELDRWIGALDETAFKTCLPPLRKVFSAFSGPARRKIALRLRQPEPAEMPGPQRTLSIRPLQRELLLPALREWLWG